MTSVTFIVEADAEPFLDFNKDLSNLLLQSRLIGKHMKILSMNSFH